MKGRFARLAIGVAVLPLVCLAAGLLLITNGGNADGADHGVGHVKVRPVAGAGPNGLARRSSFVSANGLPPGRGALVAQITSPTAIRSSPGGARIGSLGLKSQFGSPVVVWVRRHTGKWLGVVSPVIGNGKIGWIPISTAKLRRVNYQLDVSLSQRHVTVLYRGRQVERYLIAIGRPTAPTPTGDFAVTDRLKTGDPSGPYGCCILATSALAPHAIQDWSGGNRIAIHSTPETSSIGQNVSHGCMRLTLPEGAWLIEHIPLGTPVIIRE
jgi:lipoprotein-anchoring transpeptidase ErfK/SrfK